MSDGPLVVVLGGGPAGLYAALLLARRGIPVTVLERGTVPGGLAAGTEVAGMSVDHGSHRLHPSIDPEILADLRSLLGDEIAERTRHGRIRLARRWLSFPLVPSEIATRLPLDVTVRLAAGAARAAVTPWDGSTFASVVETGLGRPMGELFYYPYAEKIWGVDAASLSGEQARRRISADSPWKLARKALTSRTGRTFLYPTGGFGRIAAAIAEAATDAGAEVRLGTPVIGLRGTDGGWEVEVDGRDLRTVSADLVLSTIPMTVLGRLLGPPPHVQDALGRLRSRSMVLVYLVVAAARWTEYDAHYFPEEGVPFTRISEPKNYRDSEVDPSGTSVLCVEVPCDAGDEIWREDDETLRRRMRAHVVAEGLPDPGTTGAVRRLTHAYPVYGLESEHALSVVDGWLSALEGLVTYGRQGLFAHDNTHHALAMARDAAACVSPSLGFDEEGWASARRRFAAHVVED